MQNAASVKNFFLLFCAQKCTSIFRIARYFSLWSSLLSALTLISKWQLRTAKIPTSVSGDLNFSIFESRSDLTFFTKSASFKCVLAVTSASVRSITSLNNKTTASWYVDMVICEQTKNGLRFRVRETRDAPTRFEAWRTNTVWRSRSKEHAHNKSDRYKREKGQKIREKGQKKPIVTT